MILKARSEKSRTLTILTVSKKCTFMRKCFAFCLFLLVSATYLFAQHSKQTSTSSHSARVENSRSVPSTVVFGLMREDSREKCEDSSHPDNISVLWSNTWQRLNDTSNLYIYSAHIDNRLGNTPYIRAISASKGTLKSSLFCRIWYEPFKSFAIKAKLKALWISSWDSRSHPDYYQPMLISCPVPQSLIVVAVSITSEPCKKPRNIFKFASQDVLKKYEHFAVCLKPLYFNKDISTRLLEWLELLFLLGTDVISIYVYEVHPLTWRILASYAQKGKVIIRRHTLPGEEMNASVEQNFLTENVWQKRRHEMIVYNDCFYRQIHSHEYVVNLDLDEAILPVLHDSWKNLLKHAIYENPKLNQSASISVANVYFFDSFEEDADNSIPIYMHMLRHTYRSANFTPPGFAQKSFFSTNNCLIVSNHYSLRSLRPHVRLISAIDKQFAQLHHYRATCPPLMDEDCKTNYMKFRKKRYYFMEIQRRVNSKCKKEDKKN